MIYKLSHGERCWTKPQTIIKLLIELKQLKEVALMAQCVVDSSCDEGKTPSIKVSLHLLGGLENKLNEVHNERLR